MATFACGLIAGRFMSFFLKLVSRLVLNLAAENGMTVPVAELLFWAETPSSVPGEPRKPLRSTPEPPHSSLLGQKPAASHWDHSEPHHTFLPTNPPGAQHHPTEHKWTQSDLPRQSHQRALHQPSGGSGCAPHRAATPRSSLQNLFQRRGYPFYMPVQCLSSCHCCNFLSACTKPLTFSSSAGQPASRACLAPLAAAAGLSLRQQPEGAARSCGAERDAPPRPHGSGPGGTLPPCWRWPPGGKERGEREKKRTIPLPP